MFREKIQTYSRTKATKSLKMDTQKIVEAEDIAEPAEALRVTLEEI
jgi:hypothetical protein